MPRALPQRRRMRQCKPTSNTAPRASCSQGYHGPRAARRNPQRYLFGLLGYPNPFLRERGLPNQREMEPLATVPSAFVIASCLGHGWSLLHMLMQHPAPTRELSIATAIRGINASMPGEIQTSLSEQHCTAFFLLTKPQITDLCSELPQCKLKH